MTYLKTTIALAIALSCGPADSSAQVRDRPARPFEGLFGGGRAPDPNRLGHRVVFTSNLLGGYDDITAVAGSVIPGSSVQPRQSGSTGFVDGTLSYILSRRDRSLELAARGYLTSYSSASATFGNDFRIDAGTDLGRRTHFQATQTLRNEPYLALGEFGQLAGVGESGGTPETDPTLGLADARSLGFDSAAFVSREWTTRQAMSVGYSYGGINYQDDELGLDSRSQTLRADHTWRYSRTAGLHLGYDVADTRFPGRRASDTTTHTGNVGWSYSRRISPTRTLALSFDVGSAYLRAVSRTIGAVRGYWTPSGRGTVRIDIGRSWAANVDYSRTLSVLDRISVQRFASDAIMMSAGGLLGHRFDLTVAGGVARGETPAAESSSGSYESYTATTQLRWALARCCATTASYSYYDYTLRNVFVLGGLPSHSTNNGLRVGFTIWLPLYGSGGDNTGTR